MRILFWMDGFFPRIGGIETHGLSLIKALQECNHTCLVIANRDNQTVLTKECYDGVNILRFDFSQFVSKNRHGKEHIQAFKENLLQIIDSFSPDILHVSLYLKSSSGLMYLMFKKLFNCPTILTLHSIPHYQNVLFELFNYFFSNVSKICCVSHSVYEQLQSILPSTTCWSRVIYHGLPIPKLLPSPLSFISPMILCLGRFTDEKGFDLAIKAFANIQWDFPEARLILAGAGEQETVFKKIIAELKLSEKVGLIGAVATEDVPKLINQATMVLMPSLEESFGFVALEAALMERPVIASAVGGLIEMIEDNQTGILVPVKDVMALSEAILRLLESEDLAISMGKRARTQAIKKFSIKSMVTSYQQVYQSCLQNVPQEN